jgi:hypothetical protein
MPVFLALDALFQMLQATLGLQNEQYLCAVSYLHHDTTSKFDG